MKNKEVAKELGVHPLTVGRWLAKYREGGMKALLAQARGRREGSGRQLTPDVESRLQVKLVDKPPDQLKLLYSLWTRKAVQQMIKRETGKWLSIRAISESLKRCDFTVQKPKKQDYEQRPAELKRWQEEDYPAIHARAKAEGSDIYWGGETGLRSNSQHVRGYLPQGVTPVLRLNTRSATINLIYAVTNHGKVRLRSFDGTMNAQFLTDLTNHFIRDAKQKATSHLRMLKKLLKRVAKYFEAQSIQCAGA